MKKIKNIAIIVMLTTNILLTSGCGPLIVASAAGTVAVIADRRTTGTIIEDNAIELKAIKKLKSSPSVGDNSKLSVTSYNERILITGQAKDKQTRQEIVEIIRSIPKIRTIYNEVVISDNQSFTDASYDSWLTTKVKASLAGNSDVNPLNIKVTTEDNVVYLMGLVTKKEATAATDVARKISGVKKVVKLFEYIDSPNNFAMN